MAGERELIREGKFSAFAKLPDTTSKEFDRANRRIEVVDEEIIMTNLDNGEVDILPPGTQLKINYPVACHREK